MDFLKRWSVSAITTPLVALAAIALAGCPSGSLIDALGDGLDATSPTTSGIIRLDSSDTDQLALSWTAATDDSTAAADLEYRGVYSTEQNDVGSANAVLATYDAVSSNSTTKGKFVATGLATHTVTGLTRETAYFINIVALDEASNTAEYGYVSYSSATGPLMTLTFKSDGSVVDTTITHNFGTFYGAVGEEFDHTLVVTNTGDQPLTITDWSLVDGDGGTNVADWSFVPTSPPVDAIVPEDTYEFIIRATRATADYGWLSTADPITVETDALNNPAYAFAARVYTC